MAITKIIADSITSGAIANTPSFYAYLGTADQSISINTWTKIAANNEVIDTGSMYNTSTYRFTPTVAGTYYIYGGFITLQNNIWTSELAIKKNGSFYAVARDNVYANTRAEATCSISGHVVFNGSSDYVELYGGINMSSGTPKFAGSNGTFNWGNNTYFGGYKIIE